LAKVRPVPAAHRKGKDAMEEYYSLIALGVGGVIVILLLGLALRLAGIRYRPPDSDLKKKSAKSTRGKGGKKQDEKEAFFQQDAYEGDGGGGEWQDVDLYAQKDGLFKSRGIFDDDDDEHKKGKEKLESWDDY